MAQTVDRRVVVSPAQARDLLAAVRGLSGRGQHLEAFYACLYYAALRPSEAVMLRDSDLHLPAKGWGRIVLAASASRAGTAWTDSGTARQELGLKHRAVHETRTIPIPPDLVKLLRAHIKRYGTTPDGRIFQTARSGILQDSAYGAVWAEARKAALTAAQYRSPLGQRPLRPASRGGVAVAELRGAGDRGRPQGRARRRGPAEDLRALHRRPGRCCEQADHRRPRRPGHAAGVRAWRRGR